MIRLVILVLTAVFASKILAVTYNCNIQKETDKILTAGNAQKFIKEFTFETDRRTKEISFENLEVSVNSIYIDKLDESPNQIGLKIRNKSEEIEAYSSYSIDQGVVNLKLGKAIVICSSEIEIAKRKMKDKKKMGY